MESDLDNEEEKEEKNIFLLLFGILQEFLEIQMKEAKELHASIRKKYCRSRQNYN